MGYFGHKIFIFMGLALGCGCKILQIKELPAKYSIETRYAGSFGASLFCPLSQYSWVEWVVTPRDCRCVGRGFLFLGLTEDWVSSGSEGLTPICTDDTDLRTGTAKAKCGGLSTAQQTMELSVASVEMTRFLVGNRDKQWR
jgi:hypothetical protein